jgi:hypothetical protein
MASDIVYFPIQEGWLCLAAIGFISPEMDCAMVRLRPIGCDSESFNYSDQERYLEAEGFDSSILRSVRWQ